MLRVAGRRNARTSSSSCTDARGGQRAQQLAAVAAREQPVVEHRHHAAVVLRAQQPAVALLEQQRRPRQLHAAEAGAAVALGVLGARRHQRLVGRRERQLVQHHQRQRLAGHVDALPEARRAEQHRVDLRRKRSSSRSRGSSPWRSTGNGRSGASMRCTSSSRRSEVNSSSARPPLASTRRRISSATRTEGAVPVSPRGTYTRTFSSWANGESTTSSRPPADAEAPAHVGERAAHGERRRHEHGRVHGVEQQLLELGGDVDGGRAQLDVPAAVALRPHHRGRVVAALEHRLQREGQAVGVPGQRVGLLAAAAQQRAIPRSAARMPSAAPAGRRSRSAVRSRTRPAGSAPNRRSPWSCRAARSTSGGSRRAAAAPVDVAREAREDELRQADAERVGGRVLQLVGLVEHHQVVRGQDRRPAAGAGPQRQVGHVEGVVDEHHVDLARAGPRGLGEAAVALPAGAAAAAVGPHGQLVPDGGRRDVVELVAVAGARRQHPVAEPHEVVLEARGRGVRRRRPPGPGTGSWRGP